MEPATTTTYPQHPQLPSSSPQPQQKTEGTHPKTSSEGPLGTDSISSHKISLENAQNFIQQRKNPENFTPKSEDLEMKNTQQLEEGEKKEFKEITFSSFLSSAVSEIQLNYSERNNEQSLRNNNQAFNQAELEINLDISDSIFIEDIQPRRFAPTHRVIAKQLKAYLGITFFLLGAMATCNLSMLGGTAAPEIAELKNLLICLSIFDYTYLLANLLLLMLFHMKWLDEQYLVINEAIAIFCLILRLLGSVILLAFELSSLIKLNHVSAQSQTLYDWGGNYVFINILVVGSLVSLFAVLRYFYRETTTEIR